MHILGLLKLTLNVGYCTFITAVGSLWVVVVCQSLCIQRTWPQFYCTKDVTLVMSWNLRWLCTLLKHITMSHQLPLELFTKQSYTHTHTHKICRDLVQKKVLENWVLSLLIGNRSSLCACLIFSVSSGFWLHGKNWMWARNMSDCEKA